MSICLPFTRLPREDGISEYNINWAKVEMEHAETWQEMNSILDSLEEEGFTRLNLPATSRYITNCEKLINHYFLDFQKNSVTLRWFEYQREKLWAVPRQVTLGVTELLAPEVTGYRSFYQVINRFKKLYSVKFDDVYGGGNATLWGQLRGCVPRPVNYATPVPRVLDKIYKADISSCYGFETSKSLPTLRYSKRVKGRVDPSEEYPFVFYLKSKHIAVLNEFDTREFKLYSEYYDTSCMYSNVDKEISLCCKAAALPMTPIINYYYERRQKYPEYKQYMNLFVGYCYKNDRPAYAHIAAVVLARAAMRILRLATDISHENIIRLIATDSIIWQGEASQLTTKTKKLGAFLEEYSDIQAVIMGAKKYQLKTDDEVITKWSGVKRENMGDFKFGDLITSTITPLGYKWDGRRFTAENIGEDEDAGE